MDRKYLLVFLVFLTFIFLTPTTFCQQSSYVKILSPLNNSSVKERVRVKGTVFAQNSKVYVIVHPLEVSDYWVQPSTTIKSNKEWETTIYIGRPGSIDIGKSFEIRAVVNPKRNLSEAMILGNWPEAQAKSAIIELTRR